MAFSSYDVLDSRDLTLLRGVLEDVCAENKLSMMHPAAETIAYELVKLVSLRREVSAKIEADAQAALAIQAGTKYAYSGWRARRSILQSFFRISTPSDVSPTAEGLLIRGVVTAKRRRLSSTPYPARDRLEREILHLCRSSF